MRSKRPSGGSPPMDQLVRSPLKTAPYIARKAARSTPIPYTDSLSELIQISLMGGWQTLGRCFYELRDGRNTIMRNVPMICQGI